MKVRNLTAKKFNTISILLQPDKEKKIEKSHNLYENLTIHNKNSELVRKLSQALQYQVQLLIKKQ